MAALTSVFRVHQLLLARVDEVLQPMDLTFARYEMLRLLCFSRHGSLPLGKTCVRLQVHPSSVTNVANRLEAAGYLRRSRHPTDARTVLAEVTPAGRSICDEATARLNDEVFSQLGLEEAELDQLFSLMKKMRRTAGDTSV